MELFFLAAETCMEPRVNGHPWPPGGPHFQVQPQLRLALTVSDAEQSCRQETQGRLIY